MIKLLKNLTVYKWIVIAVLGLVFIQSMADLYLPTLMADIIDKGVSWRYRLYLENRWNNAFGCCFWCCRISRGKLLFIQSSNGAW